MNEAIHRVIRAIDLDLAHAWTLREMADIAGMSEKYFSTLFKLHVVVYDLELQKVHLSPSSYLKWARMEAAAEQISDPDCRLSIKEIAGFVGQDPSHFTKDFKAHFGLTPSKFREEVLEKFQTDYESARNRTFGQENR